MRPSHDIFSFFILVLINLSSGISNDGECLGEDFTEQIMKAETIISEKGKFKPRTYRICPGTTANIATYDWDTKEYVIEDGTYPALQIWNPLVQIVCGWNENDNDCTFRGGDVQVELLPAREINNEWVSKTLWHITFERFKFTRCQYSNIMVYGVNKKKVGAILTVKDSDFYKNKVHSMIWLGENYNSHLNIDNCSFRKNKLIDDSNSPDAGIITSYVGGNITVTNSLFQDNDLEKDDLEYAFRSIIYAVEQEPYYTNNTEDTNLILSDSIFRDNVGATFALVMIGLWGDGYFIQSRNIQTNNLLAEPYDHACFGVARLEQNFADYYEYYYDYNWNETQAEDKNPECLADFLEAIPISSNPTLSSLSTNLPSEPPTNSKTLHPIEYPSVSPTVKLTKFPTPQPFNLPTSKPTDLTISPSTFPPTEFPSQLSTIPPTKNPTNQPTSLPTKLPTDFPTSYPTFPITLHPTEFPSHFPTTSSPTKSPTKFRGCWSDNFTEKVMAEESKLRHPRDFEKIREYRMCPGSTATIAEYDQKGNFLIGNGSVPALSIWNPNIHILCGWHHSDCTFTGGTFQIEILDAKKLGNTMQNKKLTNVVIQGFQFTDCQSKNIVIHGTEQYGSTVGAEITIKNSNFHENLVVVIIDILQNFNTNLIVDNCTFTDNTLVHPPKKTTAGLINAADISASISIRNSQFIGNIVGNNDDDSYNALVFLGGIPFPVYSSSLHIHDSTFIENNGMSTGLAAGGFLYDGAFSTSNNFAFNNTMKHNTKLLCPGIVRIRRKGFGHFYEECIVNFDTSFEALMTSIPTLEPTTSITSQSLNHCWSKNFTELVMLAENLVTDVSKPRTYRMCKHTIAEIQTSTYDTQIFNNKQSKMRSLTIWNSNVNIVCGNEENDGTDCTFNGGTHHIIIESKAPGTTVENILIQGFKFTGASDANILVLGADVEHIGLSAPGASVLVKKCRFTRNKAYTMIWLSQNYNTYLNIQECSFDNNQLIDNEFFPNAGVITSYVAGKISVTNSVFKNNDLERKSLEDGFRSLIYAVEDTPTYSGNQHYTDLIVFDSKFMDNRGITFAIVMIGLWGDGKFTQSNNYEALNQMSNPLGNRCNGIAQIILDYYYYYDYFAYTWNSTVADIFSDCLIEFSNTTYSPSSSPTATISQTNYPSPSSIKEPTDLCNDESGEITIQNGNGVKTVTCIQNKKKLRKYCEDDKFKSFCIKSCNLCHTLNESTVIPTISPTKRSSASPSISPTISPTKKSSASPTINPTTSPTKNPSASPVKESTHVCNNGIGEVTIQTGEKVNCKQSKRNLRQFYCKDNNFKSVCRKKCGLCFVTSLENQ